MANLATTTAQPTKKGKSSQQIILETGKKDKPLASIENFLRIMRNDQHYSNIQLNEMTGQAEYYITAKDGSLKYHRWTDADSARSREYIERNYGIYHVGKHEDALLIYFDERRYNPILEIIQAVKWDGQLGRCEQFLTKYLKVPDTPYSREVSRLIFAGGIHRLCEPGCKFDSVPIFIGPNQGEGKSTVLRWLALNDRYFTETTNLSGDQRSIEDLQGKFIIEIGELAAFRASEIEKIKLFLTKLFDHYRLPYARYTSDNPRRCIFIGTGNTYQFLTDKSGNRRYFPVTIGSDGYDLLSNENEVREYILQAWAEALSRYRAKQMPPFPSRELLDQFKQAQKDATVDDWRIGVIVEYIRRRSVSDENLGRYICTREIWDKALHPDDESPREMKIADGKAISDILDHIDGTKNDDEDEAPPKLKRTEPRTKRTSKYGPQKAWEKVEDGNQGEQDELPF